MERTLFSGRASLIAGLLWLCWSGVDVRADQYERLIKTDPAVNQVDGELNRAYKMVQSSVSAAQGLHIRNSQRAWLAALENSLERTSPAQRREIALQWVSSRTLQLRAVLGTDEARKHSDTASPHKTSRPTVASTPPPAQTATPKSNSQPPNTPQNSVKSSSNDADPFGAVAKTLASMTKNRGSLNVCTGDFLSEATELLTPVSLRIRDEIEVALDKVGQFKIITRARLDELQKEGNFQAGSLLKPGTDVGKVAVEGVEAIVRGRYYPTTGGVDVFVELVWLESGVMRKEKAFMPILKTDLSR